MRQTEQRTSKPRFNRDSLHGESNFLSDGINIKRELGRGYISKLLHKTIEHICIPIYEKNLGSVLRLRRLEFDVDAISDGFYVEFCVFEHFLYSYPRYMW